MNVTRWYKFQSTHIRGSLDEDAVTESVDTEYLMHGVRSVSEKTYLVSGHDIPPLESILRPRCFNDGVVNRHPF